MKKARLTFQWALHFFGLTHNNIDHVYEQIFVLMKVLKFSYTDAYNLPIYKRYWFLRRLKKQHDSENQMIEQSKNKSKVKFNKSFPMNK